MNDKMKQVYQKFYSSINLLSKLTFDGDYIDNISYIDSFLSEFRNITFVLQKQFSDPTSKKIYNNMRNNILINDNNLNKLVNFRDETIHEKPFDLRVEVICYIYLGSIEKFKVMSCNVNDELLKKDVIEREINKYIKTLKFKTQEVYFTYEIEFISNSTKVDILKLSEYGINKMFDFLLEFEKNIYGNNDNFKVIKEKISNKLIEFFSNKIIFSVNGVYLTKQNEIDTSFPKSMLITTNKNQKPSIGIEKTKLEKDNFIFKGDTILEKFKSFVTTHMLLFIMTKELLPVFAIIYEDGECEMIFNIAFSKADVYNTVFKIVDKIKDGNVQFVISCQQMIVGEKNVKRFIKMTHEEKMKNYDSEGLAFSLISRDDKNINIFIPSDKIKDISYVMNQIDNNDNEFFNYVVKPIEEAIKNS